MARPGWLFQRVELTEGAGLCLRAGIDCAARNSPIPDDQVKENSEIMETAGLILFIILISIITAWRANPYKSSSVQQFPRLPAVPWKWYICATANNADVC